MRIALGLGANLGERAETIARALERICDAGVTIGAVSSLYETEPVGPVRDQPTFLNLAVTGETELAPRRLLHAMQRIESELGRERLIPQGPRTIDIDILYIDGAVIRDDELVIPHPRMHERKFVLMPLAEIAPNWVHPVLLATTNELLAQTDDTSVVAPFVGTR